MKGSSVCYMLALLVSLAVLVYGFMYMLRKPEADEKSYSEVISRQLRGLGLVILAPIVLSLLSSICFGKFGIPEIRNLIH